MTALRFSPHNKAGPGHVGWPWCSGPSGTALTVRHGPLPTPVILLSPPVLFILRQDFNEVATAAHIGLCLSVGQHAVFLPQFPK